MTSKKKIEQINKLLNSHFENNKSEIQLEKLQLDIVNKILKLMEQKKIKKSELAKMMHVTKGYITQIFSCEKNINLKTLVKWQNIFDITFEINIINNITISKPDECTGFSVENASFSEYSEASIEKYSNAHHINFSDLKMERTAS